MTKPSGRSDQPGTLSSGLRRFLYLTAAITGGCILIVEILGAKILSPYVGTSHFVWTAQITVTLLSLALGYYLGGWMVDRSPRLERLYWLIAGAAVYLAFSIVVVQQVAYSFIKFNLALGALLSSAVLFFVPLTLLAAVGPFLIRMLALSFQALGSQVGRLSAISTFGSVLGTLLVGYVIVPLLPNSVSMYITSGILLATSLAYFAIWGRRQLIGPVLFAIGGLAVGGFGVRADLNPQWARVTQVYRGNSDFGMLQVIDLQGTSRRYYLNDFLVQNTYDRDTRQSTSLFTYMLRYLAQGYTEKLERVLCIGVGIGIVPMELAAAGVTVDSVEINPSAISVAAEYFGFDPSRTGVIIGDGRFVLNSTTNRYDAVVLDAFLGDSSPSHLMTREAFENVKRVLKPHGVLVINSFGDLAPGRNFFAASLAKTLQAVFASVRAHGTGRGNLFFVASANPDLQLRPVSIADAHPEVARDVSIALGSSLPVDTSAGRVLTDDFNPVEFYDAENREKHRRELAFTLRKL